MTDNLFQIASWQAAIVGSIVGTVLGVVNLGLGLLRQGREDKRKRAEAGFKLTDEMFKDKSVTDLLDALDDAGSLSEQSSGERDPRLAGDFVAHFGRGEALPDDRAKALFSCVDDLSFYLDRMEHAIRCDITDFISIEMPVGYYVKTLASYKKGLSEYVWKIGYVRALDFLKRFGDWQRAGQGGVAAPPGTAANGAAPQR